MPHSHSPNALLYLEQAIYISAEQISECHHEIQTGQCQHEVKEVTVCHLLRIISNSHNLNPSPTNPLRNFLLCRRTPEYSPEPIKYSQPPTLYPTLVLIVFNISLLYSPEPVCQCDHNIQRSQGQHKVEETVTIGNLLLFLPYTPIPYPTPALTGFNTGIHYSPEQVCQCDHNIERSQGSMKWKKL